MSWPWSELGLDGPASLKEVRQAYAQRLKETHPEEDSEGFQRLHAAYQAARQAARGHTLAWPQWESEEDAPQDTTANGSAWEETGPNPTPSQKAREETFDFGTLLEQEEVSPGEGHGETAEENWDILQILHQELQENPFSPHKGEKPVDAALRMVHTMLRQGGSAALWNAFFTSVLFLQVKWEPGFQSELMNAFHSYPIKDPAVRMAALRAYGLEKGRPPRRLREFYEKISGQPVRKPSIWAKLFPRKTSTRRKLAGVAILVVMTVVMLSIAIPEWATQRQCRTMVEWLSTDLGRPVGSYFLEDYGEQYANEYYLLDPPQLRFTAVPEGKRELSQGKPGYTTSFGGDLLDQTLEQREKELDLPLSNGYDSREEAWVFTLHTNLTEDGEAVAAVAEEIQAMVDQSWWELYDTPFLLSLSYGKQVYYTYRSDYGPFSAQEVIEAYEAAPLTLYRRVIEESGLADLDFGNIPHTYLWGGEVEVEGWTYELIIGLNAETGEVMRLYFHDIMALRSIAPEDLPTEQDGGNAHLRFRHYIGFEEVETDAEIVEQMGVMHLVRK